jgi:hypothetical protein
MCVINPLGHLTLSLLNLIDIPKKIFARWFDVILILISISPSFASDTEIYFRVNQLGYLENDPKIAIIGAYTDIEKNQFFIRNLKTHQIVFNGRMLSSGSVVQKDTPFPFNYLIDFSPLKSSGTYRIELQNGNHSYAFKIGNDVYKKVIDKLLLFMRVARCGNTDPLLHQPCHLNDATNMGLDLTGGWHDAGDFLKFTRSEAYTTYTLLLSYAINEKKYADRFSDIDRNGMVDVLDEALIGLNYLIKVFPDDDVFVYQVGDFDKDHDQGFRMPEDDKLASKNRPALIGFHRNVLCQYSFAMSLGYATFREMPEYRQAANQYLALAKKAYSKAKIIGEKNIDKLCLAATELYRATGEEKYLKDAKKFNDQLFDSDWGNWSDNTNLAHARLAPFYPKSLEKLKTSVVKFHRQSLEDLFGYNVAYVWAGLYVAISSASAEWFYRTITLDDTYNLLSLRIRDYLLGVNPWGISFISGLGTIYPMNMHTNVGIASKNANSKKNAILLGAIPGGPVDPSYWKSHCSYCPVPVDEDIFSRFHTASAVYHDHIADYVTNEPTIYGSSEGILFFSFYLEY